MRLQGNSKLITLGSENGDFCATSRTKRVVPLARGLVTTTPIIILLIIIILMMMMMMMIIIIIIIIIINLYLNTVVLTELIGLHKSLVRFAILATIRFVCAFCFRCGHAPKPESRSAVFEPDQDHVGYTSGRQERQVPREAGKSLVWVPGLSHCAPPWEPRDERGMETRLVKLIASLVEVDAAALLNGGKPSPDAVVTMASPPQSTTRHPLHW